MIIRHDGALKDAQILSRAGARMRVAIEGCEDTVELGLKDGQWYWEEAGLVSLEFLSAAEIPMMISEAAGRRLGPGHQRVATV